MKTDLPREKQAGLTGDAPHWVAGALIWLILSATASAATVTVTVDGLDQEARDNALAFLEINRLSERQDLSELVVRLQYRKAEGNIRAALRPLGYYAASVVGKLDKEGENWQARFVVTPGQRVRVRKTVVRVEGPGSADSELNSLVRTLAPSTGEAHRDDRYEALKNGLMERAVERGYFEARYSRRELNIYPEDLAADITLVLESGPRYRVGEIAIEQDALHDWIIRRYLQFSSGDYFDASDLLNLQYALYDSDYFSFVEVSNGVADAQSLTVPVSVKASAGKRQRYRAALGYGTDTEARIGLGWENRRINLRGHKLSLDTRLSKTKQEVTGRYIWPLSAPSRKRVTFDIGGTQEDLADTRSRRLQLGVTHTLARKSWQRDLYVRLLRESTREPDLTSTETLLLPGVLWQRNKKDNLVYPRKGSRFSAELKGSNSAFGSDVDFLQLTLQGKLIYPIRERARLIGRAELGATSVGQISSLPASLRFFAGGDQSVRGFGLNTLGPKDDTGAVIGGRYLLTSSIEFEQLLTEHWGFAVFVDGGNALQDWSESLEFSAGAGLRWLSPVGMLRLDVARPLNAADEGPRLSFSVGADL